MSRARSSGAKRVVVALLCAAVAWACASAPSRFYTLRSTAVAGGEGRRDVAVLVGPVTVPGSVDRPELVVQASPNRVDLQEFDRWAGPLNESIARTVAGDLAVLLGTPRVAAGALANFAPAYRVTIDVQRFDSSPGVEAVIEAVWVVHEMAGRGRTRTGQTIAREAVAGEDLEALVAAHSRALAVLSSDVAAAIRGMSAGG